MKILITGHNGFIGRHLVPKLEAEGHQLILADLTTGIDVCDFQQIESLEKSDLIIHLANLSFVPASFEQPKDFYQVNFTGTLNVLELCRKHKSNLIYFSSYIYGKPEYQPIDEKHTVLAFNPYAQSKVICESLCEGYQRDFGVNITIFRPFNIYGPGQNPDFLIPSIIRQAREGKITVRNDRPKRDYIHIDDIVGAVLAAIQKNQDLKGLSIFNLGSGKSYSVKEAAEIIMSRFDHPIEYYSSGEMRLNEVMDTIADISLIRKSLDWEPKISFEEGLDSIINS
jgi:UDP-glucose 4-epimerase